MKIEEGAFVRHQNQASWGMGKVLEVVPPDKVRIRFASVGEKLLVVSAAALEVVEPTDADQRQLVERRARNRKVGLLKSHDELVQAFLARYPGGFQSSEYARDERNYKVAAHELATRELGAEALKEALAAGRNDDIVEAAHRVMNATNLVFPNEKIAFRNAVAAPEARERFARVFVDLLHGDGLFRDRFDAFAESLADAGAGKWTVATYYPYLLFPREHMFLKPEVTQRAADAYGYVLEYEARPNWNTYEKLLAFAQMVSDRLAPLRPTDMLDVQSFIWVAGAKVAPPAVVPG
jgi:hypothetical protein